MVEDSDTQTHLEEKTLIYDETSAFEDKNNRGCDKDLSDKAELLKTRLQELQKEIDIFKKENDLIVTMKKELELEKETFLKEKAEAERKMNEDKIVSEFYLAEEKEKLAKQKALYDRHIKDMKGQSLKKDREEISVLRKELSELKEQMKTRDAKVGATQARLRNQVKNLEKDNVDLKIDSERLTKENTKLRNSNLRSQRISNIKSLAEINKSLAQFSKTNKMTDVEIEDVYPEKNISKEFLEGDVTSKSKKNKRFIKPTVIKHKPIRAKSVPNLSVTSEYAKYFSKRDEETIQSQREQLGYGLYSDNESSISSDSDLEHSRSFQSSNKQRKRSNKSLDLPKVRDFHNYSHSKKSSQNENPTHKISDDNLNKSQSRSRRLSDLKSHEYSVEQIYSEKFNNNDEGSQNNSFLAGIPKYNEPRRPDKPAQPNSNSNNDHVIIDRPDGSKEIRFTNGNVKIVSPDGSYSKFLYYNGDVKETLYNEGTIKYYYKEVNTRHTTYKDGSQVLEFPDGQIERRYPDGSVESRLADGGTRWARAGGTQEWRFPDGTLLVVTPQGDRTLRFPNGQVEVHTKDHKRREFPDGTVKVVYADGVVETRYANGRIRVKDKQDKLILDSAGSGNIPHNVS